MRKVLLMLIAFCALCLAQDQTSGIHEEYTSDVGQQESGDLDDYSSFPLPPSGALGIYVDEGGGKGGNNESTGDVILNGDNEPSINKTCKHGVYYSCPLPCPQTCEFFNKPCNLFIPACVPDEHGVCGCPEGDVLNEHNKCVSGREFCQQDDIGNEGGADKNKSEAGSKEGGEEIWPKCEEHEEFYPNGIQCPQTCAFFDKEYPIKNLRTLSDGVCGCSSGYVKNDKDKCVNATQYCKNDTDEDNGSNSGDDDSNEPSANKTCKYGIYYSCPLQCPQTCEFFYKPCSVRHLKPPTCIPDERGVCACPEGEVLNEHKKCVSGKEYCKKNDSGSGDGNDGDSSKEGSGSDEKKCGENQELYKCGAPCPQTCGEFIDKICPRRDYICLTNNTVCGCRSGYVRNDENKCVNATRYCKNDTDDNGGSSGSDDTNKPRNKTCKHGVYYSCPLPCPQTCEYFNKPCKLFIPRCIPDEHGVCGCPEGEVLNEEKKCVSGDEYCKKDGNGSGDGNEGDGSKEGNVSVEEKCKENEELYKCGAPCPQTCGEFVGKICPRLDYICITNYTVCGCRSGYVRNDENKCVNAKRYCKNDTDDHGGNSGSDDPNEPRNKTCKHGVYYSCPLPCPQTCEYFNKPCKLFIPRCIPDEHGVCGCPEGEVLNEHKKCVSGDEYCKKDDNGSEGGNGEHESGGDGSKEETKCGENEELYKCSAPCPQTCAFVNKRCPLIRFKCITNNTVCGCGSGYVRNDENKCVNATRYCKNETNGDHGENSGDDNSNEPSGNKTCTDGVYYSCPLPCPQTCEFFNKPCKILIRRCIPDVDGVCGCRDGYVLNEHKKCVSGKEYCQLSNESEGANKHRKCGSNQKLFKCGLPCPQTCEYINNKKCVKLSGNSCHSPVCGCIKGYVRNKRNECVKAKHYCAQDTDESKKCPPNQTYYRCGLPCPQTCHFVKKQCKYQRDYLCKPERDGLCGCIKDHVRNQRNKCVPAKDYCDPSEDNSDDSVEIKKCSKHEMFYQCGLRCAQTCENISKRCEKTPSLCKSKNSVCGCIKDFVRNKRNKCVNAKEYCSKEKGGTNHSDEHNNVTSTDKKCRNQNEQYYPCGVGCPQSCEDINQPCLDVLCKRESGACLCTKDYVRNKHKQCVRAIDYCNGNGYDKQCKDPNELYYNCGVGCPQSCDTLNEKCIAELIKCVPGNGTCLCKPGYVRNKDKKCVEDKDYCNGDGNDKKCKDPNEQYYSCGVGCPQSCEDLNQPCIKATCIRESGACLCKQGYVRDKQEKCVKAKNYCKQVNGDGNGNSNGTGSTKCNVKRNEKFYVCGIPCPENCENFKKPCIHTKECNITKGACGCLEKFVRNEKNKCVDAKTFCKGNETGNDGQCKNSNEQYYPCGVGCPQSCKELDQPCMDAIVKCASGNGACLCKEGYVRDKQKKCVRAKDYCSNWKKCNAQHNEQFYSCGIPYPQTCDNFNKPCIHTDICKVDGGTCGCVQGYVRNEQNKCVDAKIYCTQDSSSNNTKCKGNEQFYPCGIPCGAQTCATVGNTCKAIELVCVADRGSCGCRDGFVRNKQNECVNAKGYCKQVNVVEDNSNEKKCNVKDNEQLYSCSIPCPQTCEYVNKTCIHNDLCVLDGVCGCREGFVRNEQNKCVDAKIYCNQGNSAESGGKDLSEEQGNDTQCKENEQFYPCGIPCSENCSNYNTPCIHTEICKVDGGTCGCIQGYVRNKKKKCVDAKTYCTQDSSSGSNENGSDVIKCKENEQLFSCGIPCGVQTCATVGKPCNYLEMACINTKGTCGCRFGYVRNKQNDCVEAKRCCDQGDDSGESNQTNEQCKNPNEQYYPCGVGCPQSCKELGQSCKIVPGKCAPGSAACLCKKGYVRNKRKKCVKSKDYCKQGSVEDISNVTKCNVKDNEELYACSIPCPQTCEYINKTCIHTEICKLGGVCGCRQGYVRNDRNKCVDAKRYCNQKDVNGTNEQCKNPNEQYYPCGVGCPQSCNELGNPCMDELVKCVEGKGACLCKKEYVRDKRKKCVKAKEYCKQVVDGNSNETQCNTKDNEQFYSCGIPCPQNCINFKKPCIHNDHCILDSGVCGCLAGYVRNENNKCVDGNIYCKTNENSGEQGNNTKCKRNEQFYSCGVPCGAQTCDTIGKPCHFIKLPCKGIKGTCGCVDGYVQNKQNECVDAKVYCNQGEGSGEGNVVDITNVTQCNVKDNEELYACSIPCPQTCEYINKTCIHNDLCKLGGVCGCRQGYVRNNEDKCVNAKRYCKQGNVNGTNEQCKNPNEQYYPCGVGCPQSCNELDKPCMDVLVKCVEGKGACLCRKGYVRDIRKKCVRAKDYCKQAEVKCNANNNEKLYSCGIPCPQNCENLKKPCIHTDNCMSETCGCLEGYVRNENNKCVDAKIYCKQVNDSGSGEDQENPTKCKGDEQFYSCGVPCEAQTCETVGKPCNYIKVACKGIKGACGCRNGYVRNKKNKCVRAKDYCKLQNGDGDGSIGNKSNETKCDVKHNEQLYPCGVPCPQTCETINKSCIHIEICKLGGECGCREGYVRNEKNKCVDSKLYCGKSVSSNQGKCVEIESDEIVRKCHANETFYLCGRKCPETCTFQNGECTNTNDLCTPSCGCATGFVRNEEHFCISAQEYCCGDNEHRSCQRCDKQCANLKLKCSRKNCVNGCYCKDGFARNSKRKCVSLSKCGRKENSTTG